MPESTANPAPNGDASSKNHENIFDNDEEEEQPFVAVTSKRGRRGHRNSAQSKFSSPQIHHLSVVPDASEPAIDEDYVEKQLAAAQLELTQSHFYRDALQLIRSQLPSSDDTQSQPVPIDIVCFGIGRFADCHIARHQLAFIRAVQHDLAAASRVQFHEPILSAAEQRILARLNCDFHPANVEGKHPLRSDRLTLAFLPHCPKQLTNNLLWRNWTAPELNRCLLICNSFQQLCDRTPRRFLDIDAGYIVRLREHCEEKAMRNSFRHRDIFNDTSVHRFRVDEAFCEPQPIEPVYPDDGSELITSKLRNL